jgi:hypothetical protein
MKIVLISNWFIFIVLCIKCLLIQGKTFYISTFGAYPNDNIDDSNGIQLAINTSINYGLNSTVIFGYGTYNLSSTITKLFLKRFSFQFSKKLSINVCYKFRTKKVSEKY